MQDEEINNLLVEIQEKKQEILVLESNLKDF